MRKLPVLTGMMLAAVLLLSSCDLTPGVTAKDATAFIQGELDCAYLGVYGEEYLKILDSTAEEAAQFYEWNVEQEAGIFLSYIGIDEPTDGQTDRARQIIRDIYAHSKYEVGPAEKLSSGNFASEVKIWPIDIMQRFTAEELEAIMDEVTASVDPGALEAMSDAQYDALVAGLIDQYADQAMTLVESLIPAMDYEPVRSTTLRLELGEEKIYTMSDEDWNNLDYMIIDYTGEFAG